MDRGYSRYVPSSADVPDVIKQFIRFFHDAIKNGRVDDIQDLYENS